MKQIGLLRRINILKLFYCNITGFIPDAEDPSVRMDDLMEIISQDGVSHLSVPCTVAVAHNLASFWLGGEKFAHRTLRAKKKRDNGELINQKRARVPLPHFLRTAL